ncbi:MAG: hypothetical protein GAK38_00028 [Xylophilus sp.]|nr:MAG: hypothetical protein GAK38_00028 [Xylophilus sp.]
MRCAPCGRWKTRSPPGPNYFATSVGVRLSDADALEVIEPLGLDDLFGVRVRRNPARVSVETFRSRIAQKRYAERRPNVKVQ